MRQLKINSQYCFDILLLQIIINYSLWLLVNFLVFWSSLAALMLLKLNVLNPS